MRQRTTRARLLAALLGTTLLPVSAADIYVSPDGNDSHAGTPASPLRSLHAAQASARRWAGHEPVRVFLLSGTYRLSAPLVLTSEDSGTAGAPVTYQAAPGNTPVLSGGQLLHLEWTPHTNGILQAKVELPMPIDLLFVDGQRQPMARFPNAIPGKKIFDTWNLGERAALGQDPIARERVARWADPAGGYLHAMHAHLWGDEHWIIEGRNPDHTLQLTGGWQNNRPTPPHPEYRFVEHIFEELDAPGEWFHDRRANILYFRPEPGMDLASAPVEIVRLPHLIEFRGSREKPVRFVNLRGLVFTRTARTFMENKEPLLRSDWTIYRGGAVLYEGAEDCLLADSTFDQVGGNTIFVNRYNRRITVRGCLLRESGANGVAFVGDPEAVRSPLFRYDQPFDYAALDRTPGPRTDNYPADCLVEDCLITRSGRVEKQTAPILISMSQSITVRHCSIYDVPRAGINIGDGCWGGHVIEFCDVFDTVNETGDHGSFNSWGRDRFWHPDPAEIDRQVAADPALPFLDVVRPNIIRHSRWRCDHGWDIDLDDGSSNYRIYNNLLLQGGLKLREGYQRIATNNIILNNSLHPHVWLLNSGDVFRHNIVMTAYRPAGRTLEGRWGAELDHNLFTSSDEDCRRFARHGCDAHSVVGNPLFANPAAGDFRVAEDSPARRLGFQNFPMDQFGVVKPELRRIARTPEVPRLALATATNAPQVEAVSWRGATLRNLTGQEFSAVGVALAQRGAWFVKVPETSDAYRAGFRPNDFATAVGEDPVEDARRFPGLLSRVPPGQAARVAVVRQQRTLTIEVRP